VVVVSTNLRTSLGTEARDPVMAVGDLRAAGGTGATADAVGLFRYATDLCLLCLRTRRLRPGPGGSPGRARRAGPGAGPAPGGTRV